MNTAALAQLTTQRIVLLEAPDCAGEKNGIGLTQEDSSSTKRLCDSGCFDRNHGCPQRHGLERWIPGVALVPAGCHDRHGSSVKLAEPFVGDPAWKLHGDTELFRPFADAPLNALGRSDQDESDSLEPTCTERLEDEIGVLASITGRRVKDIWLRDDLICGSEEHGIDTWKHDLGAAPRMAKEPRRSRLRSGRDRVRTSD